MPERHGGKGVNNAMRLRGSGSTRVAEAREIVVADETGHHEVGASKALSCRELGQRSTPLIAQSANDGKLHVLPYRNWHLGKPGDGTFEILPMVVAPGMDNETFFQAVLGTK